MIYEKSIPHYNSLKYSIGGKLGKNIFIFLTGIYWGLFYFICTFVFYTFVFYTFVFYTSVFYMFVFFCPGLSQDFQQPDCLLASPSSHKRVHILAHLGHILAHLGHVLLLFSPSLFFYHTLCDGLFFIHKNLVVFNLRKNLSSLKIFHDWGKLGNQEL